VVLGGAYGNLTAKRYVFDALTRPADVELAWISLS